jgi:hypothetical protein
LSTKTYYRISLVESVLKTVVVNMAVPSIDGAIFVYHGKNSYTSYADTKTSGNE